MFSKAVQNSSWYWVVLTSYFLGLSAVMVLAFSVANAKRESQITAAKLEGLVQSQILAMVSQERVVMNAMTADRLAELAGGLSANTAPPKRRNLTASLSGQSHADSQSNADIDMLQISRRGTEFDPVIPMFDVALLDAMPDATGGPQWECLSEALYFEARGEDIWGQMAVAEVILNRSDSPRFPDGVCRVLAQGGTRRHACQFSYNCDGKTETIGEPRAYERVSKLAAMMMHGRPRVLTGGATFYHADSVNPKWASTLLQTAVIGDHIFYRYPG